MCFYQSGKHLLGRPMREYIEQKGTKWFQYHVPDFVESEGGQQGVLMMMMTNNYVF